jgi:DNA-binding MarR family transcriptional regulator
MMGDDDDGQAGGAMIVWPLERLARLMRAREHNGELNPAQWEALRYLNRANRFSNSPGALTRYLGATKGTISQTLMALERKGFVSKNTRAGEKRSISLMLTPKGREMLALDPWNELAAAADELGGKTRRRLSKGLRELLAQELKRQELDSFGQCPTCRFFREKGRSSDPSGPHHCMMFDQPLTTAETQCICIAHEPRK